MLRVIHQTAVFSIQAEHAMSRLAGTIPDLPAVASPQKKNISVFPKCESL
jgi:hypothetical protein